jgi:hypothetical protein
LPSSFFTSGFWQWKTHRHRQGKQAIVCDWVLPNIGFVAKVLAGENRVKVVLEPPRKLRKVTLIIEARDACLERESHVDCLEASLHHTDNSRLFAAKKVLSRIYH